MNNMTKLKLKSTGENELNEVKLALEHIRKVTPHQYEVITEYFLLLRKDLEKMNDLLVDISKNNY